MEIINLVLTLVRNRILKKSRHTFVDNVLFTYSIADFTTIVSIKGAISNNAGNFKCIIIIKIKHIK